MICGRDGRGFGFCKDLLHGEFPDYAFCSRKCQHVGARIAGENGGFIMSAHLTDMEVKAIREARPALAQALEKHGLMPAFFNCTPDVIDAIIQACWDGCRNSMQMQNLKGEGPPF